LTVKARQQAHQQQAAVTCRFIVGHKKYPEQRITLKNQRQVNPEPRRPQTHRQRAGRADQGLPQLQPERRRATCCWTNQSTARCRASLACGASSMAKSATRTRAWTLPCPQVRRSKPRANGKVILIGNYFFNGNTVFVDHGQGFISMFCHMSKIDVKVGPAIGAGRCGGQGRINRPRYRAAHALECQPE
jgi:hypothetical protein